MQYIILLLILATLIPNSQAPPAKAVSKTTTNKDEGMELSDRRGPARDPNNKATGAFPAAKITRVEAAPQPISTTNTIPAQIDPRKAKDPRKGAPGTPLAVPLAAEMCPINAAGEEIKLLKPMPQDQVNKMLGVLKDIIVNLLGIDIDVLSAINLDSVVAVSLNDGVKHTKVLQKSQLHITIGVALASWTVGHNLFLLFSIGKGFLSGYEFLYKNFPREFVLNDKQKAEVFLKWYTCGLEQIYARKKGLLTYMDFAQVIAKAQYEAYGKIKKTDGSVNVMKTLPKMAGKQTGGQGLNTAQKENTL